MSDIIENKCTKEKHIAVFCLSELKKINGIQCVCLECDNLTNIIGDTSNMNNIVFRKEECIDPFSEYMNIIRPKYKRLKNEGLTPLEAVQTINSEKADEDKPKTFEKTTNN